MLSILIIGCTSLESVSNNIYLGMSKDSFCNETGLVLMSEDPCFGNTYTFADDNLEIITNNLETKYYIFQNKKLVSMRSSYSQAYAEVNKIRGSKKVASSSMATQRKPTAEKTTPKASTRESSYSSYVPAKPKKKVKKDNNSSANVYQCSLARNELSSANSKMRQANNHYNINSMSCNSVGGSCLTPLPRQCNNTSSRCQNRAYSCPNGDYSCTSRESSRYSQCVSQANNTFYQCQQRARQAAENTKRNCDNRKNQLQSQCRSKIKSQASTLQSNARSLLASANQKINLYCD